MATESDPPLQQQAVAPPKIDRLVERFREYGAAYRQHGYNEAQLRREFVDPFFEALGWDLANRQGVSDAYKDVVLEDRLIVGTANRAPDYSFRIGGERKFFVETKKPAVNLHDAPSPAFQLRRYAWSAKLPLSVLTDFEEFVVYDCREEPSKDDPAATARLLYIRFEEYGSRWHEIRDLFSRGAVLAGAFEEYAQTLQVRRGTSEVDNAFLRDIERWRRDLAEDLSARNASITQRQLNFAVQQTIDRIVFLRIAEARGLEHYGQLETLLGFSDVYVRLRDLFGRADDRYNSGLFHFREEQERDEPPDRLTPTLIASDEPLKRIIRRLYYPDSPYEFSVLPAQILGQVYEQFLGRVIRLNTDHVAVVEDKPEVRKAGGVYYTPTPIVNFIVESTLAPLVAGRTPAQVGGETRRSEPMRILDPACGSGSFLLGAFEYLLRWYLDAYLSDDPARWMRGRRPRVRQVSDSEWRLTIGERKRILLTHIYGVDIDTQAVEVTKLSLLLKVLEGESDESVFPQMELLQERALPDLAGNIKCGNSLIGPDIFEQLGLLDPERRLQINGFDWHSEFARIFDSSGGFDAVIGNPPYIDSELMTQVMPEWRPYCVEHYAAASGNWDIFCVFVEKALALCRPGGRHSFIVPNKLASAEYAAGARQVLTEGNNMTQLRDYSRVPVFPVSVYPIVYVAERRDPTSSDTVRLERMLSTVTRLVRVVRSEDLPKDQYFRGNHPWPIFANLDGRGPLERLRTEFPTLNNVAEVLGAATVAEAYDIAPLIVDAGGDVSPVDLKFVNSGTIDRYTLLWGRKALRYLGQRYARPIVPQGNIASLPVKRARQASSPKIIVAGMTKTLESAADMHGHFLAGKSTSIIVSDLNIRYLLGVLNSSVVDFFYSSEYGGNRLQGGYLRVGPPQLRTIPVPDLDPDDSDDAIQIEAFVDLVDDMLGLQADVATAQTPSEQTALVRQIEAKDREIDEACYRLYELSGVEAAVIDRSRSQADEGELESQWTN